VLDVDLVYRHYDVNVLQLGAGEAKIPTLGRRFLGSGPKREALQVGRALAQLHIRPLDQRMTDKVVERPAYSNGDTSFYSILHCNYMESIATYLQNWGSSPFSLIPMSTKLGEVQEALIILGSLYVLPFVAKVARRRAGGKRAVP
jgi:hypothetical protein